MTRLRAKNNRIRLTCLPPVVPGGFARQLAVIDPGSQSIKIALAECRWGQIRLLRWRIIDRHEEGLISAEESNRQLQSVIEEMGWPPLVIILPQELVFSQLVELPREPGGELKNLFNEQRLKLGGLPESAVLSDFKAVEPFGTYRNLCWVTLCQENKLLELISRLNLSDQPIWETMTACHGLAALAQTNAPLPEKCMFIDLGARSTHWIILVNGQAIHNGSLPYGSDLFTETIAQSKQCSLEQAESIKRTQNLFATGPEALPEFYPVVERWRADIETQIQAWQREPGQTETSDHSLQIRLCGGGAMQPGLIEFLNARSRYSIQRTPLPGEVPDERGVIVYGTVLQAFQRAPERATLIPPAWRELWRKQKYLEWLGAGYWLVLIGVLLVFAVGTLQRVHRLNRKLDFLAQTLTAVEKAKITQQWANRLLMDYEYWRPILEGEKRTLDFIRVLSLLPQTTTNRELWFVLIADQQAYFSSMDASNQLRHPSLLADASQSPSAYGCIAELSIISEGERMRQTLSQLVADLKRDPLFQRVDSLPTDRRKNWIDPEVILTNRYVALSLDFAENPFQRSLLPARITHNPGEIKDPEQMEP